MQIVLLVILSAITFYRREMSCNHVYVTHQEESADEQGSMRSKEQDNECRHCEVWDKVLEGAGTWGSGDAITGILLSLWKGLVSFIRVNLSIMWSDEHSDKVLESSSMYLSGEPLVASLFSTSESQDKKIIIKVEDMLSSGQPSGPSLMSHNLPSDIQVQILSFLHPKEIMSYASCSKEQNVLVDNPNNEDSLHLWKTIWDRDYGWLIESWPVGQKMQHKLAANHCINKTFYFEFGQTYIGYLLAGHNTNESCLVGLHGNIYDISKFLEEHPGSPETLLIHAGRDATKTFEDVNHSRGARNMSKSMCVAIDLFCYGGCGVRKAEEVADFEPAHVMVDNRRQRRRPETLEKIRTRIELEETEAKRQLMRLLPRNEALDNDIHVYYDALERNWKGWYTDATSFQTHYLDLSD